VNEGTREEANPMPVLPLITIRDTKIPITLAELLQDTLLVMVRLMDTAIMEDHTVDIFHLTTHPTMAAFLFRCTMDTVSQHHFHTVTPCVLLVQPLKRLAISHHL
jgi:hypothetical protein